MAKLGIALAGIVVAGGAVAFALARGGGGAHHHRARTHDVHAVGIDQTDTAVAFEAMLNAPDRATPCETAYAAISAARAAAKLRGTHSLFKWVAPEPNFLAGCRALTAEAQRCMMPRYRRDHRAACVQARPSQDALEKLVIGVPVPEPSLPR